MKKRKIRFGGPGMLIAAAFIGPGTVTVCTLTGSNFGLELLWAVLVSILITMLFQDMASRIGIVTGMDLSLLIKKEVHFPIIRVLFLGLVLFAIVIGNGAYEAGNISGGALGLETLFSVPQTSFNIFPLIVGSIAFGILWFGTHKLLEKILFGLVVLMSLSFLITAFLVQPDLLQLLSGLFVPKVPENGMLTVLGLIGTTIVPYNLFLHTSLAKAKWGDVSGLPEARKDTIISIAIGGVISLGIIVSASSLYGMSIDSAVDMGKGLESIYGDYAKYLISTGLFAAGITSAITAPLAAAYVVTGCFGIDSSLTSWKFRITWMVIIGVGVVFSSIGFRPVDVIRFAQVANGLMLPLIGGLLVWLSSRDRILGMYKSKPAAIIISSIFLILIVILGIKSIWNVYESF